jgi:hypothetical protein
MQSIQHLFSNSEFEIVIPQEVLETSNKDLQRKTLYLNENIKFYIIQTTPKHNFQPIELTKFIQNSIEIQVISTFGEESSSTVFHSTAKGSTKVEKFASLGIEFPLIPVIGKEDKVLFNCARTIDPIITETNIIYPFQTIIDVGRKRAMDITQTKMTLTAHITEIIQDAIPIDTFNYLQPLKEDFDPVPVVAPPKQTFKKLAHKVIDLSPLIACSIKVNVISHSNVILTLEFYTLETITVNSIDIEMPDTTITSHTMLPCTITSKESISMVYTIRVLDCSERDARKPISFTVGVETERGHLSTNFCARLPISNGMLTNTQTRANHGRLFESMIKDEKLFKGLDVSLSVVGAVSLHSVFPVRVLISNTGSRTRNLTLSIPMHSLLPKKHLKRVVPDMAMTPQGT